MIPPIPCASCGDPASPLTHNDCWDLHRRGVVLKYRLSAGGVIGEQDGKPRCRACYLELTCGVVPKVTRPECSTRHRLAPSQGKAILPSNRATLPEKPLASLCPSEADKRNGSRRTSRKSLKEQAFDRRVLGSRCQAQRLALGLTLSQVAKRGGVTPRRVVLLEKGTYAADHAVALAVQAALVLLATERAEESPSAEVG